MGLQAERKYTYDDHQNGNHRQSLKPIRNCIYLDCDMIARLKINDALEEEVVPWMHIYICAIGRTVS